MDEKLQAEIEGWFTYHAPTETQRFQLEQVNAAAKNLALTIAANCPPSADRSAAFRLVREARMTANAAIVIPPLPR